MLQYVIQNNADLLLHGGDLFDSINVHQNIADLAYNMLLDTAEAGVPIVLCPGNHERSILPQSLYLSHPGIHIYRDTEVFYFEKGAIKLQIAGFPYVRRNVKAEFPIICKKFVNQLQPESFKIMLMHHAIEGAVVGPQRFMFRQGSDVVQINDIPDDYDLILSGHIHPTQMLKTNLGKPILYPGSTERTAFAEKDEVKGFYEINIDAARNLEMNFIPLYARPMEVVELNIETYTTNEIKEALTKAISSFKSDSVVQIRMKNIHLLPMLKISLLDDVFPRSMNYQVAGYGRYRKKNNPIIEKRNP